LQKTYLKDPHSFSVPDQAVIKHLSLDVFVDFENNLINGHCLYKVVLKDADKIIFDIHGLSIKKISTQTEKLSFDLGEKIQHKGRPLIIKLAEKVTDPDFVLKIDFQTDRDAQALQWLSGEQTESGKPFLFTQSQAILARSWIPIQDSPQIRFTYAAKIRVPMGMLALMSAKNPTEKSPDGVYCFSMDKPIPAYLLSLAVGDIAYQSISERTGIYAEPQVIEKAIIEFSDADKMLCVAENLFGAYQWGHYDILVMPPSFPFGGMENPMLTFATPTIIAGDRSLVGLVAHELAHSWSGNLVTNATWEHFWLNEGFTVYFENRIMETLYGKDFSDLMKVLSYQDLITELEEKAYGEGTSLKLNLEDQNPDEAVSAIAYEKGFLFLQELEHLLGRELWDNFIKNYFLDFAFQSIDTGTFEKYLINYLNKHALKWRSKIDLDTWLYSEGLPDLDSLSIAPIVKKRWAKNPLPHNFTVGAIESYKNCSYQEKVIFLQSLQNTELSENDLILMDQVLELSSEPNMEIKFSWLLLTLKNDYKPIYPIVEKFLSSVGRRKFVLPIYKALLNGSNETKELGYKYFSQFKNQYHAVTKNAVSELIEV
jgi:leukotriene A-4 hydrolase/aminopeptidase